MGTYLTLEKMKNRKRRKNMKESERNKRMRGKLDSKGWMQHSEIWLL